MNFNLISVEFSSGWSDDFWVVCTLNQKNSYLPNCKVLLIILNLIEFEAKQVLLRYGIPIPKGILISDSKQTIPALNNLKPPYMVKAQVPVSGRGKAGGIIPANSIIEAQDAVTRLTRSRNKEFSR